MDKEKIRIYVLENAIKFKGKANPGGIVGKVLGDDPSLKSQMKEVMQVINMVVQEVNALTIEEQKTEFEKSDTSIFNKKEQKKEGLKDLPNAEDGKVVMRFAPSPSGPMHIGHAYAINLSSEYCRKYKGKLILRIEDTNPENIDADAYHMLEEDGQWVTNTNIQQTIIQSDRMEIYYQYAEDLFNKGVLYVDTLSSEESKKLRDQGIESDDRKRSIDENKVLWNKMQSGEIKKGEAVVRVKTDINHKNPAMRDFPVFRINDEPHPRQGTKYNVWPLMNFSVFVDDVELGMTHIIRAKDHADNAKRQEYLYNAVEKPIPTSLFVGRINFTGMPVSSSQTRKDIAEGKYSGWDDVRLPFLRALKKRGYQPEAFIKYATEVGVTKNDKTVGKDEFFKTINAFNKESIEPKSHRYFAIRDPKNITIKDAPSQEFELDLHPDNKKGGRVFKTQSEFLIEKEDEERIKDGEVIRLMDCLNFKKENNEYIFVSKDYELFKDQGKKIIHWLPAGQQTEENIKVEMILDDNSKHTVLLEPSAKNIDLGAIVQFERFAFLRLSSEKSASNGQILRFYYLHK